VTLSLGGLRPDAEYLRLAALPETIGIGIFVIGVLKAL
jgi:hypothetical protein